MTDEYPYYFCLTDNKVCHVFQKWGDKYLGRVWIGKTGEWNQRRMPEVTYMPINDALEKLGYGIKG